MILLRKNKVIAVLMCILLAITFTLTCYEQAQAALFGLIPLASVAPEIVAAILTLIAAGAVFESPEAAVSTAYEYMKTNAENIGQNIDGMFTCSVTTIQAAAIFLSTFVETLGEINTTSSVPLTNTQGIEGSYIGYSAYKVLDNFIINVTDTPVTVTIPIDNWSAYMESGFSPGYRHYFIKDDLSNVTEFYFQGTSYTISSGETYVTGTMNDYVAGIRFLFNASNFVIQYYDDYFEQWRSVNELPLACIPNTGVTIYDMTANPAYSKADVAAPAISYPKTSVRYDPSRTKQEEVSASVPSTWDGVIGEQNLTDDGTGDGSTGTEVPTGVWSAILAIPNLIQDILSKLAEILTALLSIPTILADLIAIKDFTIDFSPLQKSYKTIFPFCIPFDLVNLIKGFSATPTDFQFQIKLETGYFNINHIVDLSPFMIPILFFRYCVVALFSYILIIKTRNLIKW